MPAAYPNASLRALAKGILNHNIQKRKPHDQVEDAMELYHKLEEEWKK